MPGVDFVSDAIDLIMTVLTPYNGGKFEKKELEELFKKYPSLLGHRVDTILKVYKIDAYVEDGAPAMKHIVCNLHTKGEEHSSKKDDEILVNPKNIGIHPLLASLMVKLERLDKELFDDDRPYLPAEEFLEWKRMTNTIRDLMWCIETLIWEKMHAKFGM